MQPSKANATDGESTNELIDLTNQEYVPAADVYKWFKDGDGVAAIILDDDPFGNILRALMRDEYGNYAVATRRDDCYNRDGSLPDWEIFESGTSIDVIGINGVEFETEKERNFYEVWVDDDFDEILFECGENWHVESFESTDGVRALKLYDPYEWGYFLLEFELV
jgi:hypothetical protein